MLYWKLLAMRVPHIQNLILYINTKSHAAKKYKTEDISCNRNQTLRVGIENRNSMFPTIKLVYQVTTCVQLCHVCSSTVSTGMSSVAASFFQCFGVGWCWLGVAFAAKLSPQYYLTNCWYKLLVTIINMCIHIMPHALHVYMWPDHVLTSA